MVGDGALVRKFGLVLPVGTDPTRDGRTHPILRVVREAEDVVTNRGGGVAEASAIGFGIAITSGVSRRARRRHAAPLLGQALVEDRDGAAGDHDGSRSVHQARASRR